MQKPCCSLCANGYYDKGDSSVGIPGCWLCKVADEDEVLADKLDDIKWEEDKAPNVCGQFTPRMIDKCGVCHAQMYVPQMNWPYWYSAYDVIFCCSEECKKNGEKEFDKFLDGEE